MDARDRLKQVDCGYMGDAECDGQCKDCDWDVSNYGSGDPDLSMEYDDGNKA